jgi:hypothetical protein
MDTKIEPETCIIFQRENPKLYVQIAGRAKRIKNNTFKSICLDINNSK